MFAVVHVLDVASVRALVRSLHGELDRAREALQALRARQPGGPYAIVALRGSTKVGAVISREEIASGVAERDTDAASA